MILWGLVDYINCFLSFPGEVHLVHWNTKYGTVAKALSKKDGLAVMGFFIEIDKKAEKSGPLPVTHMTKKHLGLYFKQAFFKTGHCIWFSGDSEKW